MMTEIIRELAKEDINACCEIIRLNYNEEDSKLIKKELEMSLTNNPIKPGYLVVEEDGVIRGYGGFIQSVMSYHVYELFSINVHPKYQNKGLGTKIINAIIEKLKKLKGEYQEAQLLILTAASPKLPNYYKKFGFNNMKVFGEEKDNLMILDLKNK